MQLLTIKDFKGMNLRAGLWNEGYAAYAGGMDFYGLGDDPTKVSYAGVLQRSLAASAMPQAAVTDNITHLISEFAYHPVTNVVYGIDSASNARIYKWVPGTPNWILDHTASGIGHNICEYANALYYTAGTQLGRLSGGVYTDNFQTGLATAGNMPMKVFAGSLFVANSQYISKYDGTTWTAQKLTLPAEYVIRSMEVYRDGLYISADQNGPGAQTRIFVWDGTSPTYNDSFPLEMENFAPSLKTSEGILWIIGNRGGDQGVSMSTSLTPIWVIQPGQQPMMLFELPLRRNTSLGQDSPLTGVAAYRGGVLIGSGESSSFTYEQGIGGVWYIGKEESSGTFHASLLVEMGANLNVGGIFSSGTTQQGTTYPAIYTAYKDTSGGTYGVYQASSVSTCPNGIANGGWISLPIDAGSVQDKSWVGIKLNFESLSTGTTVIVSYRLNDTTNFTRLKVFASTDPSTDKTMFIPIGRTSRTIGIQIQISCTASCPSNRLYSFTLYYEPTGN